MYSVTSFNVALSLCNEFKFTTIDVYSATDLTQVIVSINKQKVTILSWYCIHYATEKTAMQPGL